VPACQNIFKSWLRNERKGNENDPILPSVLSAFVSIPSRFALLPWGDQSAGLALEMMNREIGWHKIISSKGHRFFISPTWEIKRSKPGKDGNFTGYRLPSSALMPLARQ
jgi:hypothetical protein